MVEESIHVKFNSGLTSNKIFSKVEEDFADLQIGSFDKATDISGTTNTTRTTDAPKSLDGRANQQMIIINNQPHKEWKNKLDEENKLVRNKARLIPKGYNQQEGIDFIETYAHVARLETIRILLAFATYKDIKLFQMDMKSAFLNDFIKEEIQNIFIMFLNSKGLCIVLSKHIVIGLIDSTIFLFQEEKLIQLFRKRRKKIFLLNILPISYIFSYMTFICFSKAKLCLYPQLRVVVWGVAAVVCHRCLPLFAAAVLFVGLFPTYSNIQNLAHFLKDPLSFFREPQLSQETNSTKKIIELGQIQLSCGFWDKGFMTIWRNKRLKYQKKTELHG
ncbi:hypothetical protein CR513_27552, partial [Mucuna pruriens]